MKAIVLAGIFAVVGALAGTRLLIGILVRKGYGQFVRDDGPTAHHHKRGTPTMGGIGIILVVLLAYALTHLITWTPPTVSGLLLLWLFAGLGIVGFLDDWTKISKERSLGLDAKAKIIGQLLVGGTFAAGALFFPDDRGITPASHHVSFLRDLPWLALEIPGWAWTGIIFGIAWITLLTIAASNAVNLTDGLDGLATGSATMVFAAYTLLNIWQSNQWCGLKNAAAATCYQVRDPLDLAVIAIALAGACFGFLWWNAKPAKIFLGDTGSLSLGGALAGFAVLTRTELLLVLLGGLFVMETLSVMLQVSFFKMTKGRRLFKMTPIHHHFELKGWNEVTVVIRFWIICGFCVAAALALFYAEWVAQL